METNNNSEICLFCNGHGCLKCNFSGKQQIEEPSLDEIISLAIQENINHLANDPEWTEKNNIHIHVLITAFSTGIMTSDPFYFGYQLPPNFEKVVNEVSLKIQKRFENEKYPEVPEVSLLQMRGLYKKYAMECPYYVEWNNYKGTRTQFVSRYNSFSGTEREFISLDVPPHNACLYLRSKNREDKKFNEEFNKKYGKNK